MSWNDYVVHYLVNHTNQNTGNIATNVCQHGALIGIDGKVMAATADFSIGTYSAAVVNDDGTSSTVEIDEFASLHDAFQNGGTTSRPGGIRIHHEKYFVVAYDADRKVMYLRKRNGGACIAKTNGAYIVGTFSGALTITDPSGCRTPQNPGATNQACEALQEFFLANNL